MNRTTLIIAGILIFLSIILGAFGAHALKEVLSPERLVSFETGVRYQMYHGLALLIVGFSWDKVKFSMKWMVNLILAGVILFSGSIYGLAMQEVLNVKLSFLGPITPFGGLLMIAGWFIFIIQLIRTKND